MKGLVVGIFREISEGTVKEIEIYPAVATYIKKLAPKCLEY